MVKNLFAAGDRFDPWIRKIPGVGNGNALQYSGILSTPEPDGLQFMGSQS